MSDVSNVGASRTNLGLSIGTDVQAFSTVLAATTQPYTTSLNTKLNGIEAGATANQSAPEILTAIKTVDGSGSGLDADLLDGNHSSAFATAAQGTTADAALPKAGGTMTGAITTNSTFDGRDVAADGTKLDGIETFADATDTANVTSAGALMDSEVTNLAQVKAFDSSDYATSSQGALADSAVQSNDSPAFGNITVTGTVDGRDIATNIPASLGTAGQVLTVNAGATAGEWADAASGGGGGLEYTTANTNLSAGGQYLLNIASNVTITLPASPTTGSIIRIVAANGIDDGYSLTVARNGSTINSLPEDLSVDTHGLDFIMWYNGTTWSLI